MLDDYQLQFFTYGKACMQKYCKQETLISTMSRL